jgi:hypothetical protein
VIHAAVLAIVLAAGAGSPAAPPGLDAPPEARRAHVVERIRRDEFEAWRDELVQELTVVARGAPAAALPGRIDAPNAALAAAQHAFLRLVPLETLRSIAARDGGRAFLERLLVDRDSLEELMSSGAPPTAPDAVVETLFRIHAFDEGAAQGIERRIALATALEHAVPVLPWSEWDDRTAKTIDAVERYAFYRDAWRARILFPSFGELATWEMRRVVDLPLYHEDIRWFHDHLPKHPDGRDLRSQREIGNALELVPYREFSPTNGISVQEGKPYYDGKRLTPPIMIEYGGVCGAVAKFGSFAARAFGVPAQPLGQEGHCAMCWKSEPDRWRTGNGSSEDDWVFSNLHGLWDPWTARGDAIPLYAALHASPEYRRSLRAAEAIMVAEKEPIRRTARLVDVAELAPTNLQLWRRITADLIDRETVAPDELRRVAVAITESFAAHPQFAIDLVVELETSRHFAAFQERDRRRWTKDLIETYVATAKRHEEFRGGRRAADAAWREFLGRRLWVASGRASPLGSWPFLAHEAVFAGTYHVWKDWWAKASKEERERIEDLVSDAVKAAQKRPSLVGVPLAKLVLLAETDESLRATAARAAENAAEALASSGRTDEALAIHRSMILAGERMGHRPWIKGFTEKALELRGK